MKKLLIGYDSAWSAKNQGAICGVSFEDERILQEFVPRRASFQGAADFISQHVDDHDCCIVAVDQPTVVPNLTGYRPVERVVSSMISWIGGGVQPANRSKAALFGDSAPIWCFMTALGLCIDPLEARTANEGRHIVEVFPALSLPGINPDFYGRMAAPKYNPSNRKKFRRPDFVAVAKTLLPLLEGWGLSAHACFVEQLSHNEIPRKADQDCLDSVICLLLALEWIEPRFLTLSMIGDLTSGHMVAAVNEKTLKHLNRASVQFGVPISN